MKRWAVISALVLVATLVPAIGAAADGIGECGDPYTPIYDIQGAGYTSPFVGDRVVTEGIVTADLQESDELRGFFLQDPNGDDKMKTSDGVFVYHAAWFSHDVAVGDYVRVEASVSEYYGQTQLGSIYSEDLITCGTGAVEPTRVTTRRWTRKTESFEGMLVTFPVKLAVTDTYNMHRFGEVWLAQNRVIETPTNQFPAGSAADRLGRRNDRRVVLLDDSSGASYPDPIPFLGPDGTLRAGDWVRGLTGVVTYSYSQYRVNPLDGVDFHYRSRPSAPDVGGDLVVASANVLNFFTTLGERGASSSAQYDVQLEKLVAEILGTGADIVGLQEMENSHDAVNALVAALNAEEGYDGIDEGWFWAGEATHYNDYPIRNEIIYRSTDAKPVTSLWANPIALADPAFDATRTDPAYSDEPIGRPPLAQMFEYDGEQFILVVNHFKSKGSPCDTVPGRPDPLVDDGQGNCNLTRVWQAEVLLEFVAELASGFGDPDVLVVGDLNSYLEEDPVRTLETELANLVAKWDRNPWSYAYYNRSDAPWIGRGLLDHAFGTASMADQVTGVAIWHINADEPRALDWYDPDVVAPGPYRASDHDPVIIGLALG